MLRKLLRRWGPQNLLSLTAIVSILGLSLGVTALLVVTSVVNGFEKELRSVLTSFHGHILMFSRNGTIGAPEKIIKDLMTIKLASKNEVTAVSSYIFAEVMLTSKRSAAGSVIEGFDPQTLGQVSKVGEHLARGRLPNAGKKEIALGVELARKLHVELGELVTLTLTQEDQPLIQKLTVVGLLKLGTYDYENKYSMVPLPDLQNFLKLGNQVNAFKIMTSDAETSQLMTNFISERYNYPFRVRNWSSLNQNMFYAIKLEKVVISLILLIIILVASFNIISSLILLIHERKRQIAMLRTMGFAQKRTFQLFLLMSFGIAVCGVFLGLFIGRSLCALLQWKSIVDLPADVYMFARLPVEIRPWEWAMVCLSALLLAVLATLLPSWQLTRDPPARGLHYE